jgi:hypothetical protein
VVVSFERVGRKERPSAEATLVPLAILEVFTSAFVPSFQYLSRCTTTYLGLEKSCGRSLGPSGTLALPRNAGLFIAGGDREVADMALEALVLRNRLPVSVVLWNLRTRSSITTVSVRHSPQYAAFTTLCVPDELADSSPDTFDPDRAGGSIVSIVRVVVRTGADMVDNSTALGQGQYRSRRLLGGRVPPKREDGFQASSLVSAPGYADISFRTLYRR